MYEFENLEYVKYCEENKNIYVLPYKLWNKAKDIGYMMRMKRDDDICGEYEKLMMGGDEYIN